MKVWYLSASVVPSRTANSVHVMKMAQAFAGGGHDVALYAWRGAGGADPFAVYHVARRFRLEQVTPLPLPGTGVLRMAAAVHAAVLRRGRPDLLYGRNLLALAAASACGAPCAYEPHNPPRSRLHARVLGWLIGRPNFAGLVVISEALRREYERLYPRLAGRVLVAPDGADPLPGAAPPPAAGAGAGRLRVGYVGSLFPGKGMETLAPLSAACPEMDFEVVGGSAADVAHWTGELARAGAGGNVTFHGHVDHGALPEHYARCDVFLAPYQRAVTGAGSGRDLSPFMSPLKLFEYMAAARPIVCSDLPVLREVLTDGEDALLAPPDDVRGWAAALRRLAGDPGLRHRLASAALERFLAGYTWDRRAERITAFVRAAAPAA